MAGNFNAENSKFGSSTIAELRKELGKRNAKLSGRKKELIERLHAYERNFNFGKELNENNVCFEMEVPSESMYKDLHEHCSIPKIDMDIIESYLEPLNKKIEKESVNLVNERFLMYIKAVQHDHMFFFKSQCKAEMRKTVKYNVDISFNSLGCVNECQCDCGSGMGPEAHCKHVNALLYALFKFSTKGVIFTEETCTQKLQTFHKAKRHQGSPIKGKDLKLTYKRKRDELNYDPRPTQYRNNSSFEGYFRSICLNFTSIGSLPISKVFIPANIPAVCHDHDYLESTPEDMFVDQFALEKITEDERRVFSEKTLNQAASKEWRDLRCYRLNSSDFGRICKLTERTNHEQFANSLTVSTDLQAAPIKHGRKYEKVAVAKFTEKTGLLVEACGSQVCSDHPFLASSPDGLVGRDSTLEVKCPFKARDQTISRLSVPYLTEDENGSLSINMSHQYYFQVQGQLLCTERKTCYFCVFTFIDFKTIEIERDDEFISKMIKTLSKFYKDYFREAVLRRFLYKNYSKFNFES